MTTLNTFSVTAETVMADCFPTSNPLDSLSTPTEETCERWIEQASADLAGRLLNADVPTSSIAVDSIGEMWCARIVTLMVGVRLARVLSGMNGDAVKAFQDEIDAAMMRLKSEGASALGDPDLVPDNGDAPSNGPISHISRNRLEQDTADNMSSVVPQFRRSDIL